MSDVARFWAKVDKTETCWLWRAGLNRKGYGKFWCDGLTVAAHKYAFENKNGPVPFGLQLRHTCDVNACVNPDHLIAGTNSQNVNDRLNRGGYSRGENHHNKKLSNIIVKEIRQRHAAGEGTTQTAKELGLSISTVNNVRRGVAWTHVKI